MEVVEKKQNDISIFQINGRLDSNTSPEFEKKVSDAIQSGAKNMILDMEALEYLSSAGLRVILKTTKDLKQSQGVLVLCSMKDYIREVFEISGFDTFLPITANRDDALKKF